MATGQGLLSPIHINEGRKVTHPGPRTKCCAPQTRVFSTGVVVSLAESLFFIFNWHCS